MSFIFRRSSRLYWLFICEYSHIYTPKWIAVMDDYGDLVPVRRIAVYSLAEGNA